MKGHCTKLVTVFCLILLVQFAGAAQTTWYVDESAGSSSGSGTQEDPLDSIQSAIDSASHGDLILVSPGLYRETINFHGKAITVKSTGGPQLAGIYGRLPDDTVTFSSNEGPSSVLEGFAIGRGLHGPGGGISCIGSSPTIRNTWIIGNSSTYGGGISCEGSSSPEITNCIILDNKSFFGGGIYFGEGDSSPVISNTIIAHNIAHFYGGGVYCGAGVSARITNSIIWNNIAAAGSEIEARSSITVSHCLVEGGFEGEENIDGDPLFVNAAIGDFHLRFASPCVDAGTNDAPGSSGTDYEGDPRILDGDFDGFYVADIGVDELVPEIAARFGTVNTKYGLLTDVLRVNAGRGDDRRVYSVPFGSWVTLSVNAPEGQLPPAHFCLYEIWWEPGASDMALQPFDIGVSCMPMPLSSGNATPPPLTIANTIGHNLILGNPLLRNIPPAPAEIFYLPSLPRGTYTFQGYIEDDGAIGPGISLTNAVVLKVL